MNRSSLWKILKKLGCLDKFVSVLRGFYEEIIADVCVGGNLSYLILIENGDI